MKPSQTAEFKAVHKEMLLLLEDMKHDHTMVDAHFITRVDTISTVLGALIERVEAGRPREPRYDDVYYEGLARLDADARGEPSPGVDKKCGCTGFYDVFGVHRPGCRYEFIPGEVEP